MTVVLGSSYPQRLGIPANTDASFPDTPGTYTSSAGEVVIPGGSLDRWFAFRPLTALSRKDVIVIGDSTTWGSDDYNNPEYSWLQKLRDLMTAAGLTVAGKGFIQGNENLLGYDAPEVNGFVSTDFDAVSDGHDMGPASFYADTGSSAGHTTIFQALCTCARVWYSARANAGELEVSTDGGAAIVANAHSAAGIDMKYVWVDGLAYGLHTFEVTNRAGRTAAAPTVAPVPGHEGDYGAVGGGWPAGTYSYKYAYVYSGGETLPSPAGQIVIAGTQTQSVTFSIPNDGQDSARVYRSKDGGPYEYIVAELTNSWADGRTYKDADLSAAVGNNPAVVGTTNLNTDAKACYVAFAGMKDTGVAVQKHAQSGAAMDNVNDGLYKAWAMFGLTSPGVLDKTDPASYSVDTTQGDADGRVNPVLAVLHLGFNDLSIGDGSGAPAKMTTGVNIFAAMCEAAGCDGIVCSGQLPVNANWAGYGAATLAALKSAAAANGLAFVDLWEYVKDHTPGTSPHLTRTNYERQATGFWSGVLGL